MTSIKKVLLCPKFHLRQFTLWLNLGTGLVPRPSQGCEVALEHAFEKSSFVKSCCSFVRRNLFPYSPLVTSENSQMIPVPSSNRSIYAQEFRSCSSLSFNCSRLFRNTSFSEMSFCSSAWMDKM